MSAVRKVATVCFVCTLDGVAPAILNFINTFVFKVLP